MFNLDKLMDEAAVYSRAWFKPPKASHDGGGWVNRWVESARVSAYWIGHVDAFVHPLFIGLVILEVVRWMM